MISIQLTGGLGNQMFAYAAGFGAARRLGTRLRIIRERNVEERPYLLDRLQVPQDEVVEPVARGRVGRRLRHWIGEPGKYRERGFHYDPSFERISDGTTLEGYFQSWRYAAGVEDDLRHQFRLAQPLSSTSARLAEKIEQSSTPVSVHVRRGDYLEPKHVGMHGTLSVEYYSKALRLLAGLVPSPSYFVFSDDLDWAMEHVARDIPAIAVSGNARAPWEDMALMSICHHHIIANSSFSWWGAWLNGRADKLVVSPRDWFTPTAMRRQNTCDLYPPAWYLA